MIRLRRKKEIKTPSTWSRLSWIEKIVMYGGPILIIWMCYMIYQGITIHKIKPDMEETVNVE